MRNRIAILVAALVAAPVAWALTLPNPASARDGAMYIGGEFGALVIADVDIVIRNPGGGVVARTRTNAKGKFLVELVSGNYTLEIPGAPLRKALDKVSPNGPARYPLRLRLALAANNREVANLPAIFNRAGPVVPLTFRITVPVMQ